MTARSGSPILVVDDNAETTAALVAADVAIVAFTGGADGERAARAAGADWFVLKPDSETLERALACVTRGGLSVPTKTG